MVICRKSKSSSSIVESTVVLLTKPRIGGGCPALKRHTISIQVSEVYVLTASVCVVSMSAVMYFTRLPRVTPIGGRHITQGNRETVVIA